MRDLIAGLQDHDAFAGNITGVRVVADALSNARHVRAGHITRRAKCTVQEDTQFAFRQPHPQQQACRARQPQR